MEPSLMVVGLNYRTAPVAVRERFWISENRRCEALVHFITSRMHRITNSNVDLQPHIVLDVGHLRHTLSQLHHAFSRSTIWTPALRVEAFLPFTG